MGGFGRNHRWGVPGILATGLSLVCQFNRNRCIGPAQPGEMFSIQGIEESRSRQDGPCLSVTGPISEAGLKPDDAVIQRKHPAHTTVGGFGRWHVGLAIVERVLAVVQL